MAIRPRGRKQENRVNPEQRPASLSERLMAARQGFGILLLGALVVLYVSNFYRVASAGGTDQAEVRAAEAVEVVDKNDGSDESEEVVSKVTELPGSVNKMSKTFEGEGEEPVKGRSDRNVLPGALNLEGPFDANKVDIVTPDTSATGATAAGKSGKADAPGSTAGVTSAAATPTPASPSADSSPDTPAAVAAAARLQKSSKLRGKRKKGKLKTRAGKGRVDTSKSAGSDSAAGFEEAKESATKMSAGEETKSGAAPAENDEPVKKDGMGNVMPSSKKKSKKGGAVQLDPVPETKPDEEEEEVKKDGMGNPMPTKKKRKKKRKKKAGAAEVDASGKGKDAGSADGSADAGDAVSSSKKTKSKEKDESSKPKSPSAAENVSHPPVDVGEHPMSRTMSELQVEGDTGPLGPEPVKAAYMKLVDAYLAPFKAGIKRSSFFNILRRKNYSLSPPESNKGIQTILFQIINQKIFLMDPYEVAKNSKAFYRTRIKEMIWLLAKVAKERNTPDTEFLVAIHDCVQTVSKEHTYRGAHFRESSPTFTIVACNFSDNLPFPMWEGDVQRGGGLAGWDAKMKLYRDSDTVPWAEKKGQAVFRGGFRASMLYAEKKEAHKHCKEVGRSRLAFLGQESPDLFDVSISGKCGDNSYTMSRLSENDHHNYKYIIYAEGNCFWADRINKQIFGPSAILKQETPCGQFYEPLLKPMTHYLPSDFYFNDATERVKWANKNSDKAEHMVKNANEFAKNYLSLSGIESYVEVLLTEYTTLLEVKKIEQEKGALDVTDGNLDGEK